MSGSPSGARLSDTFATVTNMFERYWYEANVAASGVRNAASTW